ncbi:MAG: transposase [Cohaesibacter sp.]|nr:transposase [Cohaesibacter sp.]
MGPERRRRWSLDEKLSIVGSIGIDGATVTQIAQRHDVSRQQLYIWRRELKRKGLLCETAPASFIPVELSAVPKGASEPSDGVAGYSSLVELELRHDRRLRFDSGLDCSVLTRLIRAVEAS